MDMIVKQLSEGRSEWRFAMTNNEIYELLCSQLAWRVYAGKRDMPYDQIVLSVVNCVEKMRNSEVIDVEKISDPFIRSVVMEMKRLDLNLTAGREES